MLAGTLTNRFVHNVPDNREPFDRQCSRCEKRTPQIGSGTIGFALQKWCCNNRPPARWLLVELLTGAIWAALVIIFNGITWEVPGGFIWSAGMISLAAVDAERFLLPKKILYPTLITTTAYIVVASVLSQSPTAIISAAVGWLVGFIFIFAIHMVNAKGMGFGDVRLGGLLGLYVGWVAGSVLSSALAVFMALGISSIISVIFGVGALMTGKMTRKSHMPFGVFLTIGAIITALFMKPIFELWMGPLV